MSKEFSFKCGPEITVFIENSVKFAPSGSFKLIISETQPFAEKIILWCEAYSQKREASINFSLALTSFEKKVLSELKKVPFGQTITYKGLAEDLGSPKAFRAVGRALGKNPWPLFIPCHRVVASDGLLGGFSGGLEIKKRLLDFEQF